MVIAVMVFSALSILFLISGYISTTGEAVKSVVPTPDGIVEMFSRAAIETGSGNVKCNTVCAREGKTCVLAKDDGDLVTCSARISGDYSCVCANP